MLLGHQVPANKVVTAAGVFLCVFIPLAIFFLMQSKTFEARTLIRFSLGREYVYVPESGNAGVKAPNPGDFQGVVNAEMLLLDNPELSRQAIAAVGLERAYPHLAGLEDAELLATVALDNATSIELITGSYVVKVAIRHSDPVIAAELTNALAAAFLNWRRQFYTEHTSVALRERLSVSTEEAERTTANINALLDGADPLIIESEIERRRQNLVDLYAQFHDAQAMLAALGERQAAVEGQLALQSEQAKVSIEIAEQKARIAYIEQTISENMEAIRHFSSLMPRFQLLQEIHKVQVERITDLRVRLLDSEASENVKTDDNVRVIQAAVPPLQPVSMPRIVQIAIAGIVAGFAALATFLVGTLATPGIAMPTRNLAGRGSDVSGQTTQQGGSDAAAPPAHQAPRTALAPKTIEKRSIRATVE